MKDQSVTLQISDIESNSIVYIRTIAMISIVVCHIFQSQHMYEFSSVFNVGVQVFIFMSGYLYGHKNIGDFEKWYAQRWEKIILPALVLIFFLLPFYVIFATQAIRWYHLPVYLLNIQGFKALSDRLDPLAINGMQHLWFVTAIMVAYIITPLLQGFRLYPYKAFLAITLILVLAFVFLPMRVVWILEWTLLYAMGYYYAILCSNGGYFIIRIPDSFSIGITRFNGCVEAR